jgi:hypothetical protein
MHSATARNNLPVLRTLLYECRRNNVAPYNIGDIKYGATPLFYVRSSEALELYLEAGFDDLDMVRKYEEMPLLYFCIGKNLANGAILSRLGSQLDLKWKGFTPIEFGKKWKM